MYSTTCHHIQASGALHHSSIECNNCSIGAKPTWGVPNGLQRWLRPWTGVYLVIRDDNSKKWFLAIYRAFVCDYHYNAYLVSSRRQVTGCLKLTSIQLAQQLRLCQHCWLVHEIQRYQAVWRSRTNPSTNQPLPLASRLKHLYWIPRRI